MKQAAGLAFAAKDGKGPFSLDSAPPSAIMRRREDSQDVPRGACGVSQISVAKAGL
jgi:hypothetical protein